MTDRMANLADAWRNGGGTPGDAAVRLTDLIENGRRFDARDREAIACLLLQWKAMWEPTT